MSFFRCCYIALLLALPLPFVAAAPAAGQMRQDAAPGGAGPSPSAQAQAPFAPDRYRRVAPAALDQMRGGSDAIANPVNNIASDTQLRGTTDNNNATNVVTGNNMIQSSFSNAAGIPVVIQNSGANVLIQNATVVNVQFK